MFVDTDTLGKKYSQIFFLSFERTDNIQIRNMTLHYNGLSASNRKSMEKFRKQIILLNGQELSNYMNDKNTNYNVISGEWTLKILNFTKTKYGTKVIYDQLDKTLVDPRFSKNMMTHSFW